jgi:hypothetical protein
MYDRKNREQKIFRKLWKTLLKSWAAGLVFRQDLADRAWRKIAGTKKGRLKENSTLPLRTQESITR